MKDESSIFDTEPENLDRLVFEILGEQEEDDPGAAVTANGVLEQPGGQIGRYKLLSVLGEGGMGIVYLAEQEQPIKRRVALKVIKPGMDSKRIIARFEAERQALAILDHPNIAHVHDAGTTEAGRPYFVMEYVKGLPITEHCDRHKLSIEDRLNLFRQVCLAVHHAHQKGIIHRDIKPSNILVSTQDDNAVPKIIDFGVAKALSMPLTERTLATEDSQLLGTPEYMSPEQADMASEDIDTRSDIYSLGVLLYVLLTGVLPFDSDTLRTGGIDHIRQVIRETNPKTPSTRLTKLGEEAKKLAESRRSEVAALAKRLHTELEWIPLKAMRKERSERYRSASELADDIENYLKGVPLIAGPESTVYLIRKFVKRKRSLVIGIAALVVVLIAGVVVSTILAIGQARARIEAQLVAEFLRMDVLRSARDVLGREATVIDVLNAAAAKLDQGTFKERPLIEASIREKLSLTYFDLGYYAMGAQHHEVAYRTYKEQLGENHAKTNDALNWLAVSYYHGGKYREAEPLYKQVIEEARQHKAGFLVDYKHVWNANLATTYAGLGLYQEAEELLRESLENMRRDPKRTGVSGYGFHLGEIYREQGKYEEAEPVLIEALDAGKALIAGSQSQIGGYEAKFYSNMVRCMNELGQLYLAQGDDEKAEKWFEQGIDIGTRGLPGKDHPHMLRNVNELALIRIKQQRYDEAQTLLDRALAGRKLKLGEDHPETLETLNDLGLLYRAQKRYDQAEKFLTEALEARQAKLGPDHPHTLESIHELAVLYKEKGDYDKAEPLLLEAIEGRRLKLGVQHPHTVESRNNLIALYEAWGKPEKAEEWRAKLLQAENIRK
jgi:tetratricopeptide (TPR) repeat protein/tRNA A-37 threonylcarbamoyl transferase component Bud32